MESRVYSLYHVGVCEIIGYYLGTIEYYWVPHPGLFKICWECRVQLAFRKKLAILGKRSKSQRKYFRETASGMQNAREGGE